MRMVKAEAAVQLGLAACLAKGAQVGCLNARARRTAMTMMSALSTRALKVDAAMFPLKTARSALTILASA